MNKLRRSTTAIHIVLISSIFGLTRALAIAAGMHYSKVEAAGLWQLLDLELLRNHLGQSLLSLHAQPPLLNLIVGVAEKLAGDSFGILIAAVQMTCGLFAVLAIYGALLFAGVASVGRLIVAFLLLLNPVELTLEFDALYGELAYCFLCFLAFAMVVYLRSRSRRSLAAMATLMVLLTLLRSTYQWIWILLLFAILWTNLRSERRRLAAAAAITIGCSLLWPAKNYILFHHFSSSTWLPFSIAKHWDGRDPAIEAWSREGRLATFPIGIRNDQEFAAWLQNSWGMPPTGHPQLDRITKSTGGAYNWNSVAMLHMHEGEAKDDVFLIKHKPSEYLLSTAHAFFAYMRPSDDYYAIVKEKLWRENFERIATIDARMRLLCCTPFQSRFDLPDAMMLEADNRQTSHVTLVSALRRLCLGAAAANLLLLACICSFARRSFWADNLIGKVAVMLLTATIAYVFLLSNLVEVGENMRFRLETQPLVFAVCAIFLQQLWQKRTWK